MLFGGFTLLKDVMTVADGIGGNILYPPTIAAKEIAAIRYVLVKPYDKNELSAMIHSILKRDDRL